MYMYCTLYPMYDATAPLPHAVTLTNTAHVDFQRRTHRDQRGWDGGRCHEWPRGMGQALGLLLAQPAVARPDHRELERRHLRTPRPATRARHVERVHAAVLTRSHGVRVRVRVRVRVCKLRTTTEFAVRRAGQQQQRVRDSGLHLPHPGGGEGVRAHLPEVLLAALLAAVATGDIHDANWAVISIATHTYRDTSTHLS